MAIIGLSQVVVTGFAGQVSLAQLTFAGCAAFTMSALTTTAGVPFPIAPILAALVATAVGVLVALPALRLRGLMLGVVTLAFGAAVEALWFRNSQFVAASGAPVKPPRLFGIDLGVGGGAVFPRLQFGLLCLVVLVLVALGVAVLRRSALGSAMLAVRADERSAAGLGVNVTLVKVAAFGIGAFIAGLGGSLLAYRDGLVTFTSYTALGNLSVLSTGYLAGITSVFGGLLSGLLAPLGLLFTALDRWVHLGDWFTVISGIGVIITLISHPEGLATIGHAIGARIPVPRWNRRKTLADVTQSARVARRGADGVRLLEVADLTVRYGEVVAVDRVSLWVDPGQVVGLIGPNGAGKTTVIDGITGFAAADGGVVFIGDSIEGVVTHRRVRRGISRTFQSLGLYDDLTVEENLDVAVLAGDAGNRRNAVERALAVAGLGDLRARPAGELSQGQRQLVSLARAYVADPAVMLLDEPAAGLDTTESRHLGDRIRQMSSEGIGVLLVDHDVALVLSVCDYVYVLDVGQVIATGTPDEIRVNRDVMRAYLGGLDDSVDAAASVPTPVAPATEPAT
jgi:ABC-type branched-subunit amino acid transport system ATPase component/ABC-type branched-subunit amino acid transport system permease subunit